MPEAGGTSTQAGIFYQNTFAALALANLLELGPTPPRERVVAVRLEAPTEVDDIVVRYADGHQEYVTAKLSLRPGTAIWRKLWNSLNEQLNSPDFYQDDQLTLLIPELTPSLRTLRDLCERASTSVDESEWRSRLKAHHLKMIGHVDDHLTAKGNTFSLLRRVAVKLETEDQVQDEFNRRQISAKNMSPVTMLTMLRDIAGGTARRRAIHTAAPLRRQLIEEYGVELAEPIEWGISAYRVAITRLARIQIPGTQISGPVDSLFVWPRVRPYENNKQPGFEDEHTHHNDDDATNLIDLRTFPSDRLDRCVIVAGPGYGKSALMTAAAARLAKTPMVPASIPLASLASSDLGILDFLGQHINSEFDVRPDWRRLAEQGLLVLLLDGLDEVPAGLRAALLNRICRFSARFPSAPWMLTVRDPSVIIGPIEATTLELLPFNHSDIVRFIEVVGQHGLLINRYEFVRKLDNYSDLRQLARIPLFLSMLVSTQVGQTVNLPANRSELIETYLKTLFSPQAHKEVSSPADHSLALRQIAQTLAFERLEQQELGATEKEIRNVISRYAQNEEEAKTLFERVQANGIMRPQSSIRLQFPFPIVQEYLAACHLIRNFPESLEQRIEDAVQRPWAQVIQFAIEQHPNPEFIINKMLERSDDAFCTGLRLIGRCIANGAQVAHSTRQIVGDRLTKYWIRAHFGARERIGRIIVDGFSRPISKSLRKALHSAWLLEDGGGEIVSNEHDQALTLSVLASVMQHELHLYPRYSTFKPAINEVSDLAFIAILEGLENHEPGSQQYQAIAHLPIHLDRQSVSRSVALPAATDTKFPLGFRLLSFYASKGPLGVEALDAIQEALRDPDGDGRWEAIRLLAFYSHRAEILVAILCDNDVPIDQRREVASTFAAAFSEEKERKEFINEVLGIEDLPLEVSDVVRLYAARYGDRAAFENLLNRIPEAPVHTAATTISLFGYFPERSFAERAADLVKNRVVSAGDAVQFASAAAVGMRYVLEMDYGIGGGALRDAPPHPGIQIWMDVIEEWCDRNDLNSLQRLQLFTDGARLGSARARDLLRREVLALTTADIDATPFDEDEFGGHIADAIREARRRGPPIPLELAARLARSKKRSNVASEAVRTIEAHISSEALSELIVLHEESEEFFFRSTTEQAIETLAARLQVRIQRRGEKLSL